MAGSLSSDLRFSWRTIRRRPGFAITGAAVLAVGIGAVTAMLSLIYGVVLRPLPFEDPGRLVWVWATTDTGRLNTLSAPDYYDYRDTCTGFASLAAHRWRQEGVLFGEGGEPERLMAAKVSGNLFATLGAPPSLGRSFTPEEEMAGGPQVVVVSYALWRRRLGGDPAAVGRSMVLDGRPFRVVGVMGRGFEYPEGTDVWTPMVRGGREESNRSDNAFRAVGRLAAGVTLEQAQAEIAATAAHIAGAEPKAKSGWGVLLQPLQDVLFGDLAQPMLLLTGAALVLLLIACANLSSLLLARVLGRRGELAVRRALGASPWSLARQILTEAGLVSVAGAVFGIGLAWVGLRVLKLLGPPGLPRLQGVGLDLPVLLGALAASVLSGLLVGAVPALRTGSGDLAGRLREGRHTTGGGSALRMRGLLVSAQVALSLVLLVASGLLVRSSLRLQRVDPGFEPRGIVTMDLHLPPHRFPRGSSQSADLIAGLLEDLRAVPHVGAAAVADQLPPFGGSWNGIYRADRPPRTAADRFPATRRFVSDGYFRTLGIGVLSGRGLEAEDRLGGPPVAVVSRALAERLFPGEDPLGRRIVYSGRPHEIVGVVGDVKDYGLAKASRPVFYLSMRQYPDASFKVAIRGDDATALTTAAGQVIRRLERDAVVDRVGTMSGWLSQSLAGPRFASALLALLSVIALVLAAVGLFGVMACQVTERTREIGIRMALGARPRDIVSWLLGRAASMVGGGCVVGLLVSLATGRLLSHVLFATSATDGATYVTVTAVLVAAVLTSCLIPARRALLVDVASVMKDE